MAVRMLFQLEMAEHPGKSKNLSYWVTLRNWVSSCKRKSTLVSWERCCAVWIR